MLAALRTASAGVTLFDLCSGSFNNNSTVIACSEIGRLLAVEVNWEFPNICVHKSIIMRESAEVRTFYTLAVFIRAGINNAPTSHRIAIFLYFGVVFVNYCYKVIVITV